MFDSHLNGQYPLHYYAHGQERAFAIPRGDLDALNDVVETCSRHWNGAGALILAIDDKGRPQRGWRDLVAARYLDHTWLHPSLSAVARRALEQEESLKTLDWTGDSRLGIPHAAELVDLPASSERRPQMAVPEFGDPALQLISAVSWGRVERAADWVDRFELVSAPGDLAFNALVGGQLGFNMCSPLYVAQVAMHGFGHWGVKPWPYLWVFDRGTFGELVAFWNYRSTADAGNSLASVVGIPRQALDRPEQVRALLTWADSSTDRTRTPSVFVKAAPRLLPGVETTLAEIGFERQPDHEPPRPRAVRPPESDRPTWMPQVLRPNRRILRGASGDVELSVHGGKGIARLPQPQGYRYGRGADLVLQTLPTPLPITDGIARWMFGRGGYAHPRGLGINMRTGPPWVFNLRLPDRQTALEHWARDHGYAVEESRPGFDARGLLQRLGDLELLDVLADEVAVEVLVRLASLSAALGDQTVAQLDSALPDVERRRIVAALGPLVEAGLVRRGRRVECPSCRFSAFLVLRELDDEVRCQGCGSTHPLAVVDADGSEASTAYRLDGFMARVMKQHVLPVILALRALDRRRRYSDTRHVWPGLLFEPADGDGSRPFDIDLLVNDGTTVVAAECKLDARGLKRSQLRTLLAFAERTGATPAVAALAGEFTPSVRRAVLRHDGLVLERGDLLPPRT